MPSSSEKSDFISFVIIPTSHREHPRRVIENFFIFSSFDDEDSRGSSIRQMKFYLNSVTDNKKRKKTHTIVEGELFLSFLAVFRHTYLCLYERNRSQSLLLFTFYLVIIEFNDLANEQNSDSHHNSEQRGNFLSFSKAKNCSIIFGSITN